jgi:hypothetical protein
MEDSPLKPQRPARERNAALCAKILQDNSSSDEKEEEEEEQAADTGCYSATSNATGTPSPTDVGKLFVLWLLQRHIQRYWYLFANRCW